MNASAHQAALELLRTLDLQLSRPSAGNARDGAHAVLADLQALQALRVRHCEGVAAAAALVTPGPR